MDTRTKVIVVKNQDGTETTYSLRKWSPIEGRSIVSGYPLSSIPKMGEYAKNEELMIRLMGYVSVVTAAGDLLPLVSAALIENHVRDWYSLAQIEVESFRFNVSWLEDEESWGRFKATWVDAAMNLISETIVGALQSVNNTVEAKEG